LRYCDHPEIRDFYQPRQRRRTIRVLVTVFQKNPNEPNMNDLLRQQWNYLNSSYDPINIGFYLRVQYTHDPRYYVIDADNDEQINRIQDHHAQNWQDTLNVFITTMDSAGGLGAFPWTDDSNGIRGGVFVERAYLEDKNYMWMVHEIGHVFGLIHTFHGIATTDSDCSPCLDTAQSNNDYLGDRCGDTHPAPRQEVSSCDHAVGSDCQGRPWGDTDYRNFMSYSAGRCRRGIHNFSPNQRSRMLCYLDNSRLHNFLVRTGECTQNSHCDDGNPCTDDTCRENGMCTHYVKTCFHRQTGSCTTSRCNPNGLTCDDYPLDCRQQNRAHAAEEEEDLNNNFGPLPQSHQESESIENKDYNVIDNRDFNVIESLGKTNKKAGLIQILCSLVLVVLLFSL